jgi:uncharacterized protein (TIGR02466 family)
MQLNLPQKETIVNLFPVPVYLSNLGRSFTSDELSIFKSVLDTTMVKNKENEISSQKRLLDLPGLENLKEFLQTSLNSYFQKIIFPKHECTPYITISWLNTSKPGESHHRHYHPNSFISGVLYVDVVNDVDRFILFRNDRNGVFNSGLTFEGSAEANEYNADMANIMVRNGMLVMFPSSLEHCVPPVETDKHVRISLAFNSYVKGVISDADAASLELQ